MDYNYQDNLNRFKYKQTDIFNQNAASAAMTCKPTGRKTESAVPTDIFSVKQIPQELQKSVIVKPTNNKSTIFSTEPAQIEAHKPNIRISSNVKKSDIFNQSQVQQEQQQQVQKPHMKIVDQTEVKKRHEEQEKNKPVYGKKVSDLSKRPHKESLIFSDDKSYQVKRDTTKDYTTSEATMQKKRDQYNVNDEKFDYMRSKLAYGQNDNEIYTNFKQSQDQKDLQREKASFNQMWWQDTSSKTQVNENATFDKNFAHEKRAQDMQSSIFMSKEQVQNRSQLVQEQEKLIKEQKQKQKEIEKSDVQNRKNRRNYSNLNGYEQQNQQNTKSKQALIPSNLSALNCDSKVFKIREAEEQIEAKKQEEQQSQNQQYTVTNQMQAQNTYQNQMKSNAKSFQHQENVKNTNEIQKSNGKNVQDNTIKNKENDKNNETVQQQQCQVIEDFGNLNDKEEVQSVYEQDISQASGRKSKKDVTQDPQKLETWEIDPYKDRVSLLSQRKPESQDVKILEMDLKGLNEKFDLTQFKKVCARKGYHIVDLDVNYSFNKMTGRGKLLLRNNRKVADGPDSIKTHLKSLGIGIVREKENQATMENNKVKLESTKQKQKVFSQPKKIDPQDQDEESQKPVKKISEVSSRLYDPREIQKKVDKRKMEKEQQEERKLPQSAQSNRNSTIRKSTTKALKPPPKQEKIEKQQQQQPQQQSQPEPVVQAPQAQQTPSNNNSAFREKNESVQNLINNSNNAPPVIKKKRQNSGEEKKE